MRKRAIIKVSRRALLTSDCLSPTSHAGQQHIIDATGEGLERNGSEFYVDDARVLGAWQEHTTAEYHLLVTGPGMPPCHEGQSPRVLADFCVNLPSRADMHVTWPLDEFRWNGAPVRGLDSLHLYNICQAISRGHWKNGGTCNVDVDLADALCMEFQSRGYTPGVKHEGFEEQNKEWECKASTLKVAGDVNPTPHTRPMWRNPDGEAETVVTREAREADTLAWTVVGIAVGGVFCVILACVTILALKVL